MPPADTNPDSSLGAVAARAPVVCETVFLACHPLSRALPEAQSFLALAHELGFHGRFLVALEELAEPGAHEEVWETERRRLQSEHARDFAGAWADIHRVRVELARPDLDVSVELGRNLAAIARTHIARRDCELLVAPSSWLSVPKIEAIRPLIDACPRPLVFVAAPREGLDIGTQVKTCAS